MSLILEALKKSEQQRRLGEAPTFGTPAPLSRQRRTLLPLIALMIVAALGVGWWLRHTPPVANDASPARPTASTGAATPPLDATRQAPAQPSSKSSPASPKPVAARPATTKPATQPPMAPPVLPMPTTDRPGSVAPLTPMPAVATPAPAPGQAVASGPGAPHPAGPAVAGPATPAVAAPTPASSPAPKKPEATAAAAATSPARTAPAAPVLPVVWDLPYSTRKDIPELALTMHVYSDQGTDRFVVIKGERHVEGDDLGDGVMLREITPDGMVLEFKGQRFVYPRAGR